jgi:pimeloyl-ACP methyl ester carboxylesterase
MIPPAKVLKRCLLAQLLTVGPLLVATPGTARADGSATIHVAFDVVNTNTSLLPCVPDGLPYTVRGDLVLPSSGAPDGVTLYLHGASGNAWRYGEVADVYDMPAQLADRGHASLVIDMLGYGRSDKPDGNSICTGSLADIAHQIVGQLRKGAYLAEEGSPLAFEAVVIGGHSSGGWIAELETYSYHDVDGLVMLGSADQVTRPAAAWQLARPGVHIATTCARGGEVRPNYTFTWPSRQAMAEDMFYNVDPAIPSAFKPRMEPDPCGERPTAVAGVVLDQGFIATIDIPVVVVIGDHDFALKPGGTAKIQCARYLQSPGCVAVILPKTGHMMHLERTAPLLHDALDQWLDAWTSA